MSSATTTTDPARDVGRGPHAATSGGPRAAPVARRDHAPIPFGRILGVELRKMFDTRSGFWMMTSIVLLAVVATVATVLLTDAADLGYGTIAGAIGTPMAVILPIVAILSVTSEWSQRSALTTFTLVPSRGRVIAAKGLLTVGIGAASMVVAMAVGALGNLAAADVAGVDPVWDQSLPQFGQIVLANEIGMSIGFMLGVLFRSSPAAIVGYFVYSLVLPGISGALASSQQWYADNAGWIDLNWTAYKLFDSTLTRTEWTQLAVTSTLWLLVPLVVGLFLVRRSEVK